MRIVKVMGAIASTNGITLFMVDGTSEALPNEGFRTAEIMAKIAPALAIMQVPVEVDLEEFSIAAKVEELTGGAVKLEETVDGKLLAEVKGEKVDVSAMRSHAEASLADKAPEGLARFMESFAQVKHQHSARELMDFMQRGDLPIADDGCIIGYKVLAVRGYRFVDKHTCSVSQTLGSLVYMPHDAVDADRRRDCSNGLHIASRNYLSGFHSAGDALFLIKIRPKDVISVPEYDHTKMRAAAYHIVARIDDDDAYHIVNRRTPLTDLPKFKELLEQVIAGNHTAVTERVFIREPRVVEVTAVEAPAAPVIKKPTRAIRATGGRQPKITPKEIKRLAQQARDKVAALQPAYRKKLERAQAWIDKGKSQRWVAKRLGMDRESLSKNLKLLGQAG